jgi:cation diffusion facilitator CzcD-associated flavoprotein CzcO
MTTRDGTAVIGAGPSGLEAARLLRQHGLAVTVFERHTDVGGIWDIDNPGTPMYESAHFISSRTMSALAGMPFPDDYPDYPRWDQLRDYLRAYAERFGLYDVVELGTAVERIVQVDGGWDVHLADGEVRPFANVVMCTGNQWVENRPEVPGTFTGEQMHSREYRSIDQLRGRRVLVVGAGNSGCDIACDAALAADEVSLSMRRGYWFVPKHILGMPADVFASTGPRLPARAQQRVFATLLRRVVGDVTSFGLPAPDHLPLSSHPIMNTQVLHHLAHGDLTYRPDVARLDGEEVEFTDGSRAAFDLIVWATGYRVTFPVLERDHLDWRGDAPDLFLNVVSRGDDDLFAMGILEIDGGAWPFISLQAELVARTLRARDERPEAFAGFRRLARTARPDLEGGVEHVDSPRHHYYTQRDAYERLLRRVIGALERGDVDEHTLDEPTLADRASDAVDRARALLRR